MKKNKSAPYFFLPLSDPGLLEASFPSGGLPPKPCRTVFLDSFDWRLWQRGFICFAEDGSLCLTDFSGRPAAAALPWQDEPPRCWQDLPDSELRQVLADIIQHRALLPQAEIAGTVTLLRLPAQQAKNTAEILLTAAGPGCCFAELRGSGKPLRRLLKQLERLGPVSPHAAKRRLEAALAAAGRHPADYSPSFSVALKPDMDCRTAAKLICRRLLTMMRRNEHGLREDLDTEFLHDFRVAARRSRSALTLLGGALEPDVRDRFGAAFKELGQLTGSARDFDVLLLTAAESKARLPETLHEGLDSLFSVLAKKRAAAWQELSACLAAPQQQDMLRAWENYLEQEDAAGSGRKIGKEARKIIRRRLARLHEAGLALDSGSLDQELHKVRIHGKKLRYALEFFRSLHDDKATERLTARLKQVQDLFGLNNDLAVQEEILTRCLAELPMNENKASAAVGGLLTLCRRSREELRGSLLETLRQFCADTEKLRLRRRKD